MNKIFGLSLLIFLGTLIGYVAGYFVRIIISSNLSIEDYGAFYSVFSLFMIIFILRDFGTGDYLSKKISELVKQKNFHHIGSNIFSIISFQTLFGALIAVIMFISADFLGQNIFNSESASIIIRIMSILFIINLQPVLNVLQGLGHFKHFSLFASLRLLIIFLLLVIIPINVETISYIYVFGLFIVPVFFLIHILRNSKFGFTKVKLSRMKNYLKPAIGFGAFAFITNLGFNFTGIGDSLIVSVDTILISYLLGPFQAGLYQVASPISKVILSFSIAVAGILYPALSAIWVKKNVSKSRQIILGSYKYLLAAVIPISTFMILFSGEIIEFFFGSRFLAAELSLQILVAAMVFYVFMFIGVFILNVIESSRVTAKFVIITIVLNFVFNVFGIIGFGIAGAAIATLASYLIGFALVSQRINKKLKININNMFYITSFVFIFVFILDFYVSGIEKFYVLIVFNIIYIAFLFLSKIISLEKLINRKYF